MGEGGRETERLGETKRLRKAKIDGGRPREVEIDQERDCVRSRETKTNRERLRDTDSPIETERNGERPRETTRNRERQRQRESVTLWSK